MVEANKTFMILMADDDLDDCLLLRDAVSETGLPHQLKCVNDGEQLLQYLARCDRLQDPLARPDLILLDLNMPKKDGRETLRMIKNDRQLQRIPIVILTTSTAETDIELAYSFGASSYIAKPSTFEGWLQIARQISEYWFGIVELPSWE